MPASRRGSRSATTTPSASTSPSPAERPAAAASPRVGNGCLIMAYTHIGHDSHHRQRLHPGQLRHARRPRHRRRLRCRRRALPGSPVLPHRQILPTSAAAPPSRRTCCPTRSPRSSATTTPTASTRSASSAAASRRTQLKELRAAYRLLQASKLNTTQALEAIRETIATGGRRTRRLPRRLHRQQRPRHHQVSSADETLRVTRKVDWSPPMTSSLRYAFKSLLALFVFGVLTLVPRLAQSPAHCPRRRRRPGSRPHPGLPA